MCLCSATISNITARRAVTPTTPCAPWLHHVVQPTFTMPHIPLWHEAIVSSLHSKRAKCTAIQNRHFIWERIRMSTIAFISTSMVSPLHNTPLRGAPYSLRNRSSINDSLVNHKPLLKRTKRANNNHTRWNHLRPPAVLATSYHVSHISGYL